MSALTPAIPRTQINLRALGLRNTITVLLSLALVLAGIVITVIGFQASHQVKSTLAAEKITLTSDAPQIVGMAAGTPVNSATTAHAMAAIIRHHTLEATNGLVYAQMGMYVAKPGTPKAQLMADGATDNTAYAQIDPATKQPVVSHARDIWVTSTTWRTSLGLAEMGFKLADFVAGVGALMILIGVGFAVVGLRRT